MSLHPPISSYRVILSFRDLTRPFELFSLLLLRGFLSRFQIANGDIDSSGAPYAPNILLSLTPTAGFSFSIFVPLQYNATFRAEKERL